MNTAPKPLCPTHNPGDAAIGITSFIFSARMCLAPAIGKQFFGKMEFPSRIHLHAVSVVKCDRNTKTEWRLER